MAMPSVEDVRKMCKTETTTKRKAQMAACEIIHCQSKERGCGVLVYDQHVEDSESSKYIITSSKVIQEENFAVGDYKVNFSKATKKIKTFNLKNVTKSVRHVASGLVVIFIESSYPGLKHGDKICSILSKSPLSIAVFDQSQPLFCYVGKQCYIVESNGECGEYVLKAVSDKSDTTAKSANASGDIPNGTAILQGADENVKAVGILNVVDDKPMVISPIWLKSSIAGILDGVTIADHTSQPSNQGPPIKSADASNGEPPNHVNGETSTDGPTTADRTSQHGDQEPPVTSPDASNGEPPNHVNGETSTNDPTTADRTSQHGNQEPPVTPPDASNGEPPNHVNGETSTNDPTTADHTLQPGDQEPPVTSPDASNGKPPNHVNGETSTDGPTTADHTSQPVNQDVPSLTDFPTQEEHEETSCNYEDFFVSEKIYENPAVQNNLAVGLDRTCHRVIKTWEHLACTDEINAPLEVRLSCKINSENNCTLMLFDVLTAEKENSLTVNDMINALEAIKRNDVKKIIIGNPLASRDSPYYTQHFSVFASSRDNSNIIFSMANRLNQKSNVNQNWRNLGLQFNLSGKVLDEIEFGQSTQILMKYLYTVKTDLTIGMFYKEVEKLQRQDVLKILRKFMVVTDEKSKARLMKKAIELDCDDMRDICVTLNKPSPGLKNWRHLAKSSALGIPQNICKDCEPGKSKSPTDTLFEWIFAEKENLTVGQLLSALRKIDRNDLVKDLRDHFEQNSSGQGETA